MEALNYTDVSQMPGKVLSILSPGVDAYILAATGFDWGTITATYAAIDPLAVLTASLLLQRWYEDDAQIGQANDLGVLSMITQLHAKAIQAECQYNQVSGGCQHDW